MRTSPHPAISEGDRARRTRPNRTVVPSSSLPTGEESAAPRHVEDAHLALIPLAILAAPLLARGRRGEARAWLPLALGGLFFLYVTLPVRGIVSFSTYDGWRVLLAGYWFYGLVGLAVLYVWVGRQAPYRLDGPSVLAAAWERMRRVVVNLGACSAAY